MKEINNLESLTTAEDFWIDKEKAEEIFQQLNFRKKKINIWDGLENRVKELLELANLMKETEDIQEIKQLENDYEKLLYDFNKAEIVLFLSGVYDNSNVVFSIHAGTGGVDAQDWAEMMLRMYLRYFDKKEFKAEIMHISSGEEAGIKSVSVMVKGDYAYGYLKSEAGVHRLVRQSPFNAKSLRQTSFALIEVIPYFEKEIEIEIQKDDLRIDTFRASGHGGQKVNKTDSAVRITHLPTGIAVACQSERSQLQNKETAMKILKAKLYVLKQKELKNKEELLKGDVRQGSWGNQIRSYVLHPYKMVKDLRTGWESSQVEKFLDGELEDCIESYLRFDK